MKTLLTAILLALAIGCVTDKPSAKPTPVKGGSPLPGAIAAATTNSNAAIAAVEARSAKAAASVEAIRTANASQPTNAPQNFIGAESTVALANLPPADPVAALDVEKRRSAVFSGDLSAVRKLYATAQTEAERLAGEVEASKARAAQAQAALVAAERSWSAQLEANRAANQAALDAANRKADEAVAKAYRERQNFIFWVLCGIGGLAILAGIGLAVVTSGASAWRSAIAVACGTLCLGLAQVVIHPWFNRALVGSLILAAIGGAVYLWFERKQVVAAKAVETTAEKLVTVMDQEKVAKAPDGTLTPVGIKLSSAMDDAQKKLVHKLRFKAATAP
jgi:hypothetical protein